MAASMMNLYAKCSLKGKGLNDMTAGERLSPLTSNLTQLCVKDGRWNNTPGVASAFPTRRSVRRGEGPSTVPAASPLDEATLSDLKAVLSPDGMAYWLSLHL